MGPLKVFCCKAGCFLFAFMVCCFYILDPDQGWLNFGPDLDPSCLTLLQLISNLLIRQPVSMKSCRARGYHHYIFFLGCGYWGLFQKKIPKGEEGKQYIFLWVVGVDIFQIIWVIGVWKNLITWVVGFYLKISYWHLIGISNGIFLYQ